VKPAPGRAPDYDTRIRRAEVLVKSQPFAAEVLSFYARLTAYQNRLFAEIARRGAEPGKINGAVSFRGSLDTKLLPSIQDFLRFLRNEAPGPLAEFSTAVSSRPAEQWERVLIEFWTGPQQNSDGDTSDPLEQFTLRAFLQPCAEYHAAQTPKPLLASTPSVCPTCESEPLLGVLRPEGDGGKRRLLCSFCLQEWDFRRILCPACGEENEGKLPVYAAEQFPHIRVETCDTCRCYLRTIDLTKDGNAVPIVDDLAAIPLTLWASEHGYTRLQPNLLST
jgi:FdhE protein